MTDRERDFMTAPIDENFYIDFSGLPMSDEEYRKRRKEIVDRVEASGKLDEKDGWLHLFRELVPLFREYNGYSKTIPFPALEPDQLKYLDDLYNRDDQYDPDALIG